jgi:DNA-binding LacI/PurR family transcriptional regulator
VSVVPAESSIEGGDAAVSSILEHSRAADGSLRADAPSAIVAMADAVAIGAYEACRKLSLAIPADLSIAGFDDIPTAASANPPLTTVHQPGREKGAVAADLVALLLEGGDASHRLLDTRLMIRASTAAPRASAS